MPSKPTDGLQPCSGRFVPGRNKACHTYSRIESGRGAVGDGLRKRHPERSSREEQGHEHRADATGPEGEDRGRQLEDAERDQFKAAVCMRQDNSDRFVVGPERDEPAIVEVQKEYAAESGQQAANSHFQPMWPPKLDTEGSRSPESDDECHRQ